METIFSGEIKMYVNGQLSRMTPSENQTFMPITGARQTTEVFEENGKFKMQIKRQSYSAQELVSCEFTRSKPLKSPVIRQKWVMTN
jgi:hypothetical protein